LDWGSSYRMLGGGDWRFCEAWNKDGQGAVYCAVLKVRAAKSGVDC